jgi:hypothetical protein
MAEDASGRPLILYVGQAVLFNLAKSVKRFGETVVADGKTKGTVALPPSARVLSGSSLSGCALLETVIFEVGSVLRRSKRRSLSQADWQAPSLQHPSLEFTILSVRVSTGKSKSTSKAILAPSEFRRAAHGRTESLGHEEVSFDPIISPTMIIPF